VALEGDSDGVPSSGRGPLSLLHSERRVDTMGCAAPALPKMASKEVGRARQRHRPPAGSGGGGGRISVRRGLEHSEQRTEGGVCVMYYSVTDMWGRATCQ
jgi:hypothetical protein